MTQIEKFQHGLANLRNDFPEDCLKKLCATGSRQTVNVLNIEYKSVLLGLEFIDM